MRVLKFGGTSVGKPERVEIHTAYKKEGKKAAHQLIDKLEAKYHPFIQNLYSKNASIKKATALIKEKFDILRSFKSKKFSAADAKIILAQGELISTHLFLYYVQEIGLNATLIPALDFMKTTDGEPDLKFIAKKLRKTLVKAGKHQLYITQGYICMNEEGEIDNLRRGGSDYTATLIGGALPATEIQIWTDIDGMHNTDPRVVKDTFPIHELSFDEAAELAYFGAKILHPSCVLPAQKSGVPVKLLNTMEPTAKGTVISEIVTPTPQRVKAIAAKDGITAIKIKSSRMLNAYGFLKKIFEVFEDYQTSIDISGVAAKVINTLAKIPLRMISSGGSRSNISILLDSKYKVDAMNALNEGLFADILKKKRAVV